MKTAEGAVFSAPAGSAPKPPRFIALGQHRRERKTGGVPAARPSDVGIWSGARVASPQLPCPPPRHDKHNTRLERFSPWQIQIRNPGEQPIVNADEPVMLSRPPSSHPERL